VRAANFLNRHVRHLGLLSAASICGIDPAARLGPRGEAVSLTMLVAAKDAPPVLAGLAPATLLTPGFGRL
jgi:hypothetical protein